MTDFYYQTMDAMYKAGAEKQYIDGWACGYLHNPRRGQQYLTEAYEAGYADGMSGNQDGYQVWVDSH
jgi:hypothetical protein